MPVSTWFVVVRFDSGEGLLRTIIAALQSLALSFFGEDADLGGTTNVLLGGGWLLLCWVFC